MQVKNRAIATELTTIGLIWEILTVKSTITDGWRRYALSCSATRWLTWWTGNGRSGSDRRWRACCCCEQDQKKIVTYRNCIQLIEGKWKLSEHPFMLFHTHIYSTGHKATVQHGICWSYTERKCKTVLIQRFIDWVNDFLTDQPNFK
jgi:hypothetical protein